MQLQDLTEFKGPSKWPWLLLLVVAIIAVALFLRIKVRNGVDTKVHVSAASENAAEGNANKSKGKNDAKPIVKEDAVFENIAAKLKIGSDLESSDRLADAREYYLDLLKDPLRVSDRMEIEKRLGRIGINLIMSPRKMPEKIDYVVQKGDFLERIAKKYGTTAELIQISNNLSKPQRIQAGDSLRVLNAKFRLEISKSRNDMIVYLNDRFFKRYSVGSGKYGKTPEGTFEISEKIKEPTWWRPDGKEIPYGNPENILGTRWMALRSTGSTPALRGYGIHGTWQPESIGKSESAGCIRMRNEDVEELFVFLPVGTPVVIVP